MIAAPTFPRPTPSPARAGSSHLPPSALGVVAAKPRRPTAKAAQPPRAGGSPPPRTGLRGLAVLRPPAGLAVLVVLLAAALPLAASASPLSPVGCAGAHCPAPAAPADVTVRAGGELREALRGARGGEVIALAPGDHGVLTLSDLSPSAPVTLRSADPSDPARLSGMMLRDVSGLRLQGLVLDYAYEPGTRPTGARPFQIHGGSDVAILGSTFEGDVASGTGSAADDGYAAGTGLFAWGTRGLEIRGSLFTGWFRGAVLREIDDLALVGNRVTDIRSDGLNLVAVQGALVEGNEIGPFRLSPRSKDHADMIQFWTNKTDRPSTDVTIRGNVLHAGGGGATHSIFMRNEEVDNGRAGREMFYRDVVIEDNVIANAHLHGITVGEALGVTIRRNTLVRVPSAVGPKQARSPNLSVPTIRVSHRARDVVVEGNVTGPLRPGEGGPTGLVLGHGAQPDWRVEGNVLAQDRHPDRPGFYGALFVAATGPERPLEGLRALPGGPLADGSAGAPRLRFDPAPDAIVPVIRVERDPQARNLYAFDAGLSAGPEGTLAESPGATVSWRFPDGGTAEGARVARALPPGRHVVEAAIRLPGGREAEAQAAVSVPSPRVLALAEDEPIALGEEPVRIGADAIAGYFGAADLSLSFRFRAGGWGGAGGRGRDPARPSRPDRVAGRAGQPRGLAQDGRARGGAPGHGAPAAPRRGLARRSTHLRFGHRADRAVGGRRRARPGAQRGAPDAARALGPQARPRRPRALLPGRDRRARDRGRRRRLPARRRLRPTPQAPRGAVFGLRPPIAYRQPRQARGWA